MNRDSGSSSGHAVGRFMELEGLRGLAAIVVVLFHALLVFYPGMMYGVTAYGDVYAQNMRLEDNWYGNPFNGILSGTFAVSIFFVLSGFVLTIGFFQKKNPEVIKRLAAKRYVRLMLPALVSIIFAYILMKFGFSASQHAAIAITHSAWLQTLWTSPPHFFEALAQGLYGMFVEGHPSYNPVLWTIYYEMIGSFIVFGVALLFTRSKYRWLTYVVLLFLFWNTWLLGFIIGMMMADVYVARREVIGRIRQYILWISLFIGLFLGGYPANETTGTVYAYLNIPQLSAGRGQSLYTAIGAGLIVFSVLLLPRLSGFFANRRISTLGKYTYSLYLVHMPLLLTVCTGIFVLAYPHFGFHIASVIAVALYLAIAGVVTYLFERLVDGPSIKLSSVLADIYFEKRTLSINNMLSSVRIYASEQTINMQRRLSLVFSSRSLDDEE